MADTIETLRARVEAAQALAAKATPGPYHLEVAATPAGETPWGEVVLRHHPAGGAGTPIPGLRVMWQGRASWGEPGRANASLLAAAPDLVTLAADLLALAESQAKELTAIRTALGDGADEAAWKPGETVAQAVERLREMHAIAIDALGMGHAWPLPDALARLADAADHLFADHSCDAHGYEEVIEARESVRRSVDLLRRLAPAGHEGPHAEALAGEDGR